MSRYGIIVNVDRCAGCFACAVACKEENQVAPGIFWEKIKRDENVRDNVINWFRMSCMHCDDPACMKVCPMKAIHKGPHDEVLVDQQKCIGCKMCANACPYDVPVFNPASRQKITQSPETKQTLLLKALFNRGFFLAPRWVHMI